MCGKYWHFPSHDIPGNAQPDRGERWQWKAVETAAAVAGSKLAVLYCKDGGRGPPFYSSTKSLAVERGTAARNLALFHDIPTGHTKAMLAPPPPPPPAALSWRVGWTAWYIFAALGASLVLPLWIATSQEGLTIKAVGLVYKQPDGSDAEFHVLFCFSASLASSLLLYLYPLFYNILPPLVTSCSVWPAYPLVAFSFLLITPLVLLVHSYRDLLANLPWVSRTCSMLRERFVGVNCAGITAAARLCYAPDVTIAVHPRCPHVAVVVYKDTGMQLLLFKIQQMSVDSSGGPSAAARPVQTVDLKDLFGHDAVTAL